MIFYGTKTFVKQLGCVYQTVMCRHCRVQTRQEVIRNWTWFTLFFIPLIPLWKSYFVVCPNCGEKTKIKKSDAKHMISQ